MAHGQTSAALLLCSLFACAHAPPLPSLGFRGLRVETVQPDLATGTVRLDLVYQFEVANPLPVALPLPQHRCTVTVDGLSLEETPLQPARTVAPGTTLRLDYPLSITFDQRLGSRFGREVDVRFLARFDLDLQQLAAAGLPGAEKGLAGLAQLLPPDLREGTVTLQHDQPLRLPLLPRLEPSAPARVVPIGNGTSVDLATPLLALEEKLGPLVTLLGQVLQQRLQPPTLKGKELLRAMGLQVAEGDVAHVVQVLNRALHLAGYGSLVGPEDAVALPLPAVTAADLIRIADPQADAQRLLSDLQRAAQGARLDAPTVALLRALPTSLPQGVRVQLPFRLHNPNAFAIAVPIFRLQVTVDGAPLLRLRAVPAGLDAAGVASPLQRQELGAQATAEMLLVSELLWEQLGVLHPQLGAQRQVSIDGELEVDPGYGQLRLPVHLTIR